MKTPSTRSHPRSPRTRARRALGALLLALALASAIPAAASAYVTPAQAEAAAERGATWFESNQDETSGALSSDWGMTALAAAGVNAADVQRTLLDPSAQDYYLGEWQASGPGGAGTDAERGILAGVAGGIQTSRLSVASEAERSNLVARVAELFDGTQIGEPGLLNDDIFGVLALHQAGAPQPLLRRIVDYLRTKQLPDGGWSWNASPNASADTDMTGSVIAAFCAAGVPTDDPTLARAMALLHSLQDPASGGFVAPPPYGIGVNSDTTAWVASGLNQCGIDPQSPAWTTASGKTPLDYLVSLQKPDGHFAWTEEDDFESPFETYDAVRPLGGIAFSTAAPARSDGEGPAVRPASAPAAGTTVPVTLAIDHGPGADDVRMCRVDVPDGSGLGQLLRSAKVASVPSGCVASFATTSNDGGGTAVTSLDGVAADDSYGWRVEVDGGAPSAAASEPIGFGDLVFLQYGAKVADPAPTPRVSVPALGRPASTPAPVRAQVGFGGRASWRHGRLTLAVACPRGLGARGCSGLLTARFRSHRGGALRLGGSAAYRIASGRRQRVAVPGNRALRRRLTLGGRLALRLTAVTRGEAGEAWVTRATRRVTG